MIDEQDQDSSSDGKDIDAEEVLRMGTLIYAGKIITATSGTPPGPEAPAALDAARKIIRPGNNMPSEVAEALRHLQMAAVLFTLDLADGHADPTALQHLEDVLLAEIESPTGIGTEMVLDLHDRALDYAYQLMNAEETGIPSGSAAVKASMETFQLAAVTFTKQLTAAEGLDPKISRFVEENLIVLFEEEARGS